MASLAWKQPELDPADPGVGDAAVQLFEGLGQMRLEIHVREDLQNLVDARQEDHEGPIRARITFQALRRRCLRGHSELPSQLSLLSVALKLHWSVRSFCFVSRHGFDGIGVSAEQTSTRHPTF